MYANLNLTIARQISTLMLLVLVLGAAAHPAEPVQNTFNAANTLNQIPVETNLVTPAGYNNLFINDNGTPRAREDVVGWRMAVTGVGGTPVNVPPVGTDHNVQTSEEHQAEISARATDSKMQGFLARASLQSLMTLYQETSQMIDAKHVNPPSYEDRTRGAVQNVIEALNNQDFLRVHKVSVQAQGIRNVQAQLNQLATSQPARTANEALGVMQYTIDIVNRNLGVRREVVALEFINGTIDMLDKYSAFLPEAPGATPGANVEILRTAGLEENIVGIGVELKAHAQGVEIVGVVEGGPAAQLGLQEGDILVSINGQNIGGQTLNAAADRLVGAAGTSVTVEVVRKGQTLRGVMVRRKFYVSSVTGTKLVDAQNKVGYIRVKQFSESTAEDLEKAMFSLHNQGMQGLVLDLRGNPGGLLDESVVMSDMFLPSGVIVSTKGRNMGDNTQEMAKQAKTWAVPLVVLVDENSASASEIFAAAIQDNQRGVLVGRKSYGKGTVQTHFPMQKYNATLKLTTAKFYAPSGREMAGQGVNPDVPVNVQTTSYRGSDNDADVQTAVAVIRQGVPAQMAASSAAGRKLQNVNFNVYQPTVNPVQNNFTYDSNRQVPAGLTEY